MVLYLGRGEGWGLLLWVVGRRGWEEEGQSFVEDIVWLGWDGDSGLGVQPCGSGDGDKWNWSGCWA